MKARAATTYLSSVIPGLTRDTAAPRPRAERCAAIPLPRSARAGLWALFVCGAALALVFGLVIEPPAVKIPHSPLTPDHLLHVATFLFLALVGALLWSPAIWFAGIMVAAAGLLEIAQCFCGRDMSFADWVASSAGVALGIALQAAAARLLLSSATPSSSAAPQSPAAPAA